MKILMCLIFHTRGGSAQAARYLSRALIAQGHEVHLVAGTLLDGDPQHDARVFSEDVPLTGVDYTDAWQGFEQGKDPISSDWDVPFHPSYEDKSGVPDRVFFKITPSEYAALLRCWTRVLTTVSESFQPDVLHLHHLSYAHLAAADVFPSVPMLTQLHGTEIKMLEQLDGLGNESDAAKELHGFWRSVLTYVFDVANHVAAISPDVLQRATAHFTVNKRDISTIQNGVDTSLFQPSDWSVGQKLEHLRQLLIVDPKGWDESGNPGSIRYPESDIEKFTDQSDNLKPLAMFVGRFLEFKRVPLLLQAVSLVNQSFGNSEEPPFNLLIWGGMPGEWEGEHPHTLARDLKLPNVFFSGWLPHEILSQGLNIADILVAPSYNEPFGQVYLEAMATRIPVIATRSGGPLAFVVDEGPQANGWFCNIDDVESLAQVMKSALTDEPERRRRGANALALVRQEYDWSEIAKQYVRLYEEIL